MMYKISRLLLICGVGSSIYSAALLVALGWPWMGVVMIFFLVTRCAKRGYVRLTTLGSARWAGDDDLRGAGMLGGNSGLILGRIPRQRSVVAAVVHLLKWRSGSTDACRAFWGSLLCVGRGRLVHLPQAIHTAVFSPSGGGKGVSCVIPFLMTSSDACVVVDFKGENAKLTAKHRRKAFGHRVVILDPFRVVEQKPDCFNPLDFIDKKRDDAIDECNDLAKALVIRTGEESEPHWNDSAEAWVAAVLATVVQYGDAYQGTKSLQSVREILSHPQKLDMAIKLMGESEAWGGMLARMGGQLLHFVEKERASTLTTVSRHLRFLDSVPVADLTKSSTFYPHQLRDGKMTIYLVLPPEHMRAQSALLRMWIGSLLRAVIRGGLQEERKIHFILDEAASLGHLEAIDDAVDKYRGYGVRLQFYFQSLGQLKKCFPDGQDQTLLSNTTQIFFGVNETATAEYVSSRLGEKTIVVQSHGSSAGRSYQSTHGAHPQTSNSSSGNTNNNFQQQTRKLLKPEEVIALPPTTAITFTPDLRPIYTTLLRYYQERRLGRRAGRIGRAWAACCMLSASTAFLAASIGLAMLMTKAANGPGAPRPRGVQQQRIQKPPITRERRMNDQPTIF
jgi:type IV secretion system protein VirD4